MPSILVVDDDPETCRFMKELLAGDGREIDTAQAPAEALTKARRGGYDLVVSDINLNDDMTGVNLLELFKQADPDVEVILVSGFGTLETAVAAVRAGAFDYISKPFDIVEVKGIVERALKRRADSKLSLPPQDELPTPPSGLVGRSRGMLNVYKQIAHASASDAPVLITGETGTGKELVALAIHRHSRRAARPFVPVNCGALTEGLLESELFGHVRGAFTGAASDKKGLFEQAQGGTIFLDEIGEMSQALQVRVLRTLQQGEVRPVGASRTLQVDVRAIAATHRDLDKAVESGSFRQDLYYRLNVFHIDVPPLRERLEDIPLLVAHFLHAAGERGGRSVRLSEPAMAALAGNSGPGNVRELENMLERLAADSRGGLIDVDDLPSALRERPPIRLEERLFEGLPSLEELEKRYLQHVLEAMKGNRSRAAEVMGIDRRTLYRMAERFGIDLGGDER